MKGADVVGDAEGLAAGVDEGEVGRDGLARREGDAVEQEVDAVGVLPDLAVEGVDLLVGANVAGIERRLGAEGADEFLDVLLQALALVVEDELRARLGPGLRDRPGDAALVGHAEDHAGLAGQR
jgi:hypothetical protein